MTKPKSTRSKKSTMLSPGKLDYHYEGPVFSHLLNECHGIERRDIVADEITKWLMGNSL